MTMLLVTPAISTKTNAATNAITENFATRVIVLSDQFDGLNQLLGTTPGAPAFGVPAEPSDALASISDLVVSTTSRVPSPCCCDSALPFSSSEPDGVCGSLEFDSPARGCEVRLGDRSLCSTRSS